MFGLTALALLPAVLAYPAGDGGAQAASVEVAGLGAPFVLFSPPARLAPPWTHTGVEIVSAACGDVDGDGAPDLVVGGASASGGRLAVAFGSREIPGTSDPFPGPWHDAVLKEPPHLLDVADTDGDGRAEILSASRGGRTLWVTRVDRTRAPEGAAAFALPAPITLVAAGEWGRRDGIADVIVALSPPVGGRVLLFRSPGGALAAEPLSLSTRAPVADVALGDVDDDGHPELFVAAGPEVLVWSDAGLRTQRLGAAVRAVEIGDFEPGGPAELAVLFEDGRVRVGGRPLAVLVPSSARLEHAKVSSVPGEDLVAVDRETGVVRIVNGGRRLESAGVPEHVGETLRAGAPVVAALSLRINADPLADLVVVTPGGVSLVLTRSRATFVVTSAASSGANTLRAAINSANGAAGADLITFAIGSGVQTINLASALPTITGVVTIDGTTQPSYAGIPLIVLNGSGIAGTPNGLNVSAASTVRALVIGGFGGNGITINAGGTGSIVEGCHVGIDQPGVAAFPNDAHGIDVGAGSVTIGGTGANAMNVVSGNGLGGSGAGIRIAAGSGNAVLGNLVGTDRAGTSGVQNNGAGVLVEVSANNPTIGGPSVASRNVLSGNVWGVQTLAGGEALVQGNYIGTDVTGAARIPNASPGVSLDTSGSTIGGTGLGARNVISGNDFYGVFLNGAGATGNIVQGNYIGTDAAGTAPLVNGFAGVALVGAVTNTIGGTALGARNVISGNQYGVYFDAGASGNLVQGNHIGLDPAGGAAVPNEWDGVFLTGGATTNVIGGTVPAARNVISGNAIDGVWIYGSGTTGNAIQGNYIGTDATGSLDLGNAAHGIWISEADGNTVGGGSLAAGNVISGNEGAGIAIDAPTATAAGNVIQANVIGRSASGLGAVGNTLHGVLLDAGSSGTVVGALVASAENVIASNGGDGVFVAGGTGHDVRQNSIFGNAGLGIDLGPLNGITPNDTNDPDPGPNDLQNFPVVTSSLLSGASTTVTGTLNSTPSTTFSIRAFGNAAKDPSGAGEGQTFLGSVSATTNASGNASWTIVAPGATSYVAATATSPGGSTSEFSAAFVTPQEASPASDMRATKGAGTVVNVTPYTPACGATNHAIYWGSGPIVGALSWTSSTCNRGISGSTSFDPGTPGPGGLFYFVIVGYHATSEGSYGQDSANVERPQAVGVGACDRPLSVGAGCP